MSYDITLSVKVEGLDKYVVVAEPERAHPTYNYGKLFRECMEWDYSQSEHDANGDYHTCYYRSDEVLEYVERGIKNLRFHSKPEYFDMLPENGWGTMKGAIDSLESLRECIYRTVEEKDIPAEHLWMSW